MTFVFLFSPICENSASFTISNITDLNWILHSSSQKWLITHHPLVPAAVQKKLVSETEQEQKGPGSLGEAKYFFRTQISTSSRLQQKDPDRQNN